MIDAVQTRFGQSTSQNQTNGYQRYRDSLLQLATEVPVADIMAFSADAIMILHCDNEGYHFNPDTNEICQAAALLEECLRLAPHHPLCQHLYFHLTEPSKTPNRAESTADQLSSDMTRAQAQHLQHMPSHTFLRVGRYHDAMLANIQVHKSDQAYL